MKNLLIIFCIFSFMLLTTLSSCTEETTHPFPSSKQPLCAVLSSINDSLITADVLTRGEEPKKDTVSVVDVVKADCWGAAIGFFVGGKKSGNLQAAAICAIVGAVVNSVVEGCSDGYVVISSGSNLTTINEMTNIDNVIQKLLNVDPVAIHTMLNISASPLSSIDATSERIGIIHNLMLDSILLNIKKTNLIKRTKTSNPVNLSMISDRDFKNVVDNCLKWKEQENSRPQNNIELVIQSFLSVYERCILENDIEKAYRAQVAYIDAIISREELRNEERESILAGLSVAWHSFKYWSNNPKWQSKIVNKNE